MTTRRSHVLLLASILLCGALAVQAQELSGPADFSTITFRFEPTHPTTGDSVTVHITLLEAPAPPATPFSCPTWAWEDKSQRSGNEISIGVDGLACPSGAAVTSKAAEEMSRVTHTRLLGTLPAGVYIVRVKDLPDRQDVARTSFEVSEPGPPPPPPALLGLLGDRFHVTIDRGVEGGGTTPGFAASLTDASGYFWFYDPDNIEVTVKVLDGRAVNGHFWVFAASMTDRPFTLTVVDTSNGCIEPPAPNAGCPVKKYTAQLGKNQNFLDTEAFAVPAR
jgi:hypothetical protein